MSNASSTISGVEYSGIGIHLKRALKALNAISLCKSHADFMAALNERCERQQSLVSDRERDFIWLLVCRYHYDIEKLPDSFSPHLVIRSARQIIDRLDLRRRVAALRKAELSV